MKIINTQIINCGTHIKLCAELECEQIIGYNTAGDRLVVPCKKTQLFYGLTERHCQEQLKRYTSVKDVYQFKPHTAMI